MLSSDQKATLTQYLTEFSQDSTVLNEGVVEDYQQFDERRLAALPHVTNSLNEFLAEKLSLANFKEIYEKVCRQYPYWGFKGMSGQMQLNLYNNNVQNPQKEELLRKVLTLPRDPREAKEKINAMEALLRDEKEKVQKRNSIPRTNQTYLISYFWEIQNPKTWPTLYGSSRKILASLGIDLSTAETSGDEYLMFLEVIKEIKSLYESQEFAFGKIPYWTIEHILWKQFYKKDSLATPTKVTKTAAKASTVKGEWIPPIISDLVELAYNKPTEWSKRNNLKPEKAFETKLRYTFTILGYDTTELGQGTGREPDGVAISTGMYEGTYAIVYDAKAREGKYSLGTDDRNIREYIQKKKKQGRYTQKYSFLVVSSDFDESQKTLDTLKEIYKETRVPVILLRAEDLLLMVEAKLKNIELDHEKLEDLFLNYGILTREKILEELGI